MTRSTMICISCILVSLMFAGQSHAQIDPETILGAWLLDEGTGDTTQDASGNGNDGTLVGAPNWVAGWLGNALEFSGSSHVDCGNAAALNVNIFSVSFWCNIPSTQTWNHIVSRGSHKGGGNPGAVNWGVMMVDSEETILLEVFNDTGWHGLRANTTTGEWHHVVATYDGSASQLYHDGQLAATGSGGVLLDESRPFVIGARSDDGFVGGFFTGSIDEVGYFHTILAAEDIEMIMDVGLAEIISGEAYAKARNPDPPDGAEGVVAPLLRWESGSTAQWHDVYLGTTPDLGPANLVQRNPKALMLYYHQAGLMPSMTYYWRVDEVEVDDVTIHTGDVWSFSSPPTTAYDPIPCDGMKWVDTDAQLMWASGFNASSHDVYFGTDETAVANGTGNTSKGNLPGTSYDPGPLAENTTYYWRVDEIDTSDMKHDGQVWSFTTLGPIPAGAGIKAEYYQWSGSSPPDPAAAFSDLRLTRVDPTIDFSWPQGESPGPGIQEEQFSARWTGELDVPVRATYTFSTNTDDGVRVWLDEQLIIDNWTDHSPFVDTSDPLELTVGRHSIRMEYYENGVGAVAQLYWEGDCIERQIIPAVALSPPLRASNPRPADASVDVKQTPTLRWDAGYKATQHDVYFGTDATTVAKADTTTTGVYRGRQNPASYNPAALQWNTNHYWRIDEVNNLHPDSPWKGSTWSFTTADFIVVDDFEDYNDFTPDRIWQTWRDGVGYSEPPPGFAGNGTGSQVGNDNPPFTEQTIVHSGLQAMTFRYTNDGSTGKATYSEAEREWAVPQDWTRNGVKGLSLWFYGDAANSAGRLYVGVQDSLGTRKDVPYPHPSAVLVGSWQEFNIDLQEFANAGVNLTSVKSVYIGVGNRLAPQMGGTGTLYFDDIRLYRPRCVPSEAQPDIELSGDCVVDYADLEVLANAWLSTGYLVTPTQPSTVGLVAYYPLDGNTLDASGNGHDCTAVGSPTVVNGPAGLGTGLTFTPAAGDDWVECGTWNPSEATGQLSVSIWMNWNGVSGEYMGLIGKRDGWAEDDMMWHIEATQSDGAVNVGRAPGLFIYGYGVGEIGVWEHVAFAFDGDEVKVYRNGAEVASGGFSFGSDPDSVIVFGCCQAQGVNPFNGALDEIRLYNRPLSPEEVAWLAGKTEPFSQPFDLNVDGTVDFEDFAVLADAWLNEVLWP